MQHISIVISLFPSISHIFQFSFVGKFSPTQDSESKSLINDILVCENPSNAIFISCLGIPCQENKTSNSFNKHSKFNLAFHVLSFIKFCFSRHSIEVFHLVSNIFFLQLVLREKLFYRWFHVIL